MNVSCSTLYLALYGCTPPPPYSFPPTRCLIQLCSTCAWYDSHILEFFQAKRTAWHFHMRTQFPSSASANFSLAAGPALATALPPLLSPTFALRLLFYCLYPFRFGPFRFLSFYLLFRTRKTAKLNHQNY